MTEKETTMPQDAPEDAAERTVWELCAKHDEQLFRKLDDLHSKNIHDTAVVNALRKGGYSELAEAYIDWGDIIDPDREGNETLDTIVPDPIDAPSYKGFGGPDMPDADHLEDALLQVAKEARAKAARSEVQWP